MKVVPEGLKKAVAPKLATERGRGFMKLLLIELEGALIRAAEATDQAPAAPDDDGDA